MRISIISILFVPAALFLGCATAKVSVDRDFYVPQYVVDSGLGSVAGATYADSQKKFVGIADSTTVAFYSGMVDKAQRRAGSAMAIQVLSTVKKEIQKFKPNTEDVLLLKANFQPGYDLTMYGYGTSYEWAEPDRYGKELDIDIDKVKGDSIEMEYLLAAVNRGNSVIQDLYIGDVLSPPIEYLSSSYTTDDIFIPLNVNLPAISSIEQSLVKKDGKRILMFHVIAGKEGIRPGDMVQILVKARVDKAALMKPEYRVGNE